jgi:heme exporter protein D
MNSIAQFLHMGGYAIFVWPSFAAAAIVLSALLVWSLRDLRKERQLLESLPKRRSDSEQAGAEDDA